MKLNSLLKVIKEEVITFEENSTSEQYKDHVIYVAFKVKAEIRMFDARKSHIAAL